MSAISTDIRHATYLVAGLVALLVTWPHALAFPVYLVTRERFPDSQARTSGAAGAPAEQVADLA